MSLGIFGGSFDPVHNGHLFVAEAVRESCGLERVLFVPTRAGRHRTAPLAAAGGARRHDSPGDRGQHGVRVRRQRPGRRRDRLHRRSAAALAARYPGEELTFIVGGDSLVHSRWERLDAILDRLAAFVIAPRGDVTETELDAALAELSPGAPREDPLARSSAGRRIGDA